MTDKKSPFKFDLEEYICSLPWSEGAPDEHVTLVAGNLRTLFYLLEKEMNPLIEALDEWSVERLPRDFGERLLMARLMARDPTSFSSESCPCRERCEECPSLADVEAFMISTELEKIEHDYRRREYVEGVLARQESLQEPSEED